MLDKLNEEQRTAVSAPDGALLVLAGAGSGKTRVLTHRMAWLLQQGLPPSALFAVTFTNKAAREMQHRVEQLLAIPATGMWIGTFHGLAHRLLRRHYAEAGLPETFQILDGDDQLRLVRRLLKELNLDEERWPAKQMQWFINQQKDEGLRAHSAPVSQSPAQKVMRQVYDAYQRACEQAGFVDFAELLLKAYELWAQHPELLAHYQKRFLHVLVDEFQDTNAIQYAWIRLLVQAHGNVTAVGDDDQSIYGWRGAKVENMHLFQRDFPGAQIIRLEQNYRSTPTILHAANAVIAHNQQRLGKALWTNSHHGDPITLYAACNEHEEARFVVTQLQQFAKNNQAFSDMAILYRSNAQSRVLEESLLQRNIPYRIYGGLRFFERAEIKDATGYLRLLLNRHDDTAFERVINTPTRGIGERTVQELRTLAQQQGCSLWDATIQSIPAPQLSARARSALAGFVDLINRLDHKETLSLHEQVRLVVSDSGLLSFYQQEKGELAISRKENLEELISAAEQFQAPEEDPDTTPLLAFLAHAVLESGERQSGDDDCVQLMTIHAAKGLEFPWVALVGMEEMLFPHPSAQEDAQKLEEERRLCYVGITRAMRKLFLTYAENRRIHGKEQRRMASRFIKEIPADLVQEVSPRIPAARQSWARTPGSSWSPPRATPAPRPLMTSQPASAPGLRLGQRVRHPSFGEGTVLQWEGDGEHSRVQVRFEQQGTKWLIAKLAKLAPA